MYEYYNRHPKGLKTTDCVVRAISTALDTDYLETRKELNRLSREWGFKSYKDNKFLLKYFANYERTTFQAEKGKPRLKGQDFAQKFSKGTYILKMAGHIVCCINGVIYDTWDCSYRTVYASWKIN